LGNITGAMFDQDLELAVIDGDRSHALVFPYRRVLGQRFPNGKAAFQSRLVDP
jgi:hypothetical protein